MSIADKIRHELESVRLAFARLSQREQFMVAAGTVGAGLLLLLIIGLWVSSAIGKAEHMVSLRSEQLAEIMARRGEYEARRAEHQAKLNELTRSRINLVSKVEEIARQAGDLNITKLNKLDDTAPNQDGLVESLVDLRISDLSINRLEDFLTKLANVRGSILVRRLKLNKARRKDTLEAELTIVTYKKT